MRGYGKTCMCKVSFLFYLPSHGNMRQHGWRRNLNQENNRDGTHNQNNKILNNKRALALQTTCHHSVQGGFLNMGWEFFTGLVKYVECCHGSSLQNVARQLCATKRHISRDEVSLCVLQSVCLCAVSSWSLASITSPVVCRIWSLGLAPPTQPSWRSRREFTFVLYTLHLAAASLGCKARHPHHPHHHHHHLHHHLWTDRGWRRGARLQMHPKTP